MFVPFLDREEYIEQAYLFRVYRERLEDNLPSQEILASIGEEVLATTRLPMAIDFLRGEILLTGKISDGMARLTHYFRPFQVYLMAKCEEDKSRFDQTIALQVLQREAEFLSETPSAAGLFIYQFECIARNRLGYEGGMSAMASDPHYNADWKAWIQQTRRRLGSTDFADLIYRRSEEFVERRRKRTRDETWQPPAPPIFGVQEGRIAFANKGKDPLFMFAALQRQLDYPTVPRPVRKPKDPPMPPAWEQRIKRLEQQIQLLENETAGKFDLSEFYANPPDFSTMDDAELE